MDQAMVSQVRRFNRIVTQRVGALNERFLARDRSLGEARLLWEIGSDGRDVRSLRAQLGLDSGYLSRLLRSLETAGMVSLGPKESDKRIRTARLTPSGSAERAVLDQRSDDLAESLLAPLSPAQRARLVAAMADVERLMTAAMVEVAPIDPARSEARHCLRAYFAELNRRFDTGFDPTRSISALEEELRPPAGLLLLASLQTSPIGIGALKFHDNQPAEIKRMWVTESARGLGVGRRLLNELEARAAGHGARAVRLETNETLAEAISLYRSAGYVEVAAFNDEPYAHHWFEKQLLPPSA
ncbi:MAG TPA: helix-turn-helix domain-containing GNAT family N-acetyltransferase [Candidatus Dormibacteraeota bacterium]